VTVLYCLMAVSVLGFLLSLYVYKHTRRQTLEHKAMIIVDGIFIAALLFALREWYQGATAHPIHTGLFWVVLAVAGYVGVLAIHYRFEHVESRARQEARKEMEKVLDGQR